jgi:isopenicillin-N N-acyltransferase like protein
VSGFLRRHRGKLIALSVVLALPLALHLTIAWLARLEPPPIALPTSQLTTPAPGVQAFDRSFVTTRGNLLLVRLVGSPEQIGFSHARLLYPQMVENEGIMLRRFSEQVSSRLARTLLLDLAQFRYRNVDRDMSPERLREIAAGARGFQPDPYRDVFDTFQRFVYLNALYDIALSFEHSPLIGCTTFTLRGDTGSGGHTLLARAFDFEVDAVFDRQKAVFLVHEDGKIPFASVAWPGLVGVVSGMNAEGLAVVVHGARGGEAKSSGEPVVHALRRVLGSARTLDEAVAALRERDPMVSHIVILADKSGQAATLERVPGAALHLFRHGSRAVTTNHFEGPAADDPKNTKVRALTSTLARNQRGRQLLARLERRAGVADAVALLRDRRGVNDTPLALGDRRAIDALIATHGVVMDTSELTLWVSESPHLLGRFVAFELSRLLASDYDPAREAAPLRTVAADPLLTSGEYERSQRLSQ